MATKAPSRVTAAIADIKTAFMMWRVWILLSWQDIRMRYRRSNLGPFWITLSMAITIYTMGFLYGHLFKLDLAHYYPFLAASMLSWSFIQMLVNDSTNTFIDAEGFVKQIKLPYTVYVLKVVARAFIIFFHNIIVIIPIMIIFHVSIGWTTLFIIPGLIFYFINALCYGFILALLGARYRDVGQIVISLMQVVFFLTPVMWSPTLLPERYRFAIDYNPFAQFIELLRSPLLGHLPSLHNILFVCMITVIGVVGALAIFARVRKRIVYWL